MPFKRILCAVDFSDHSNAAFYQALDLAERSGANLFLLHAVEVQPLVSRWLAPEGLSRLTMEIEAKAQEAMESLTGTVQARLGALNVRTEITSGRAFVEILENAQVWRADLVVLGARGAGTLEDAVLGSTVDRVVADCECSVLIVRQ